MPYDYEEGEYYLNKRELEKYKNDFNLKLDKIIKNLITFKGLYNLRTHQDAVKLNDILNTFLDMWEVNEMKWPEKYCNKCPMRIKKNCRAKKINDYQKCERRPELMVK